MCCLPFVWSDPALTMYCILKKCWLAFLFLPLDSAWSPVSSLFAKLTGYCRFICNSSRYQSSHLLNLILPAFVFFCHIYKSNYSYYTWCVTTISLLFYIVMGGQEKKKKGKKKSSESLASVHFLLCLDIKSINGPVQEWISPQLFFFNQIHSVSLQSTGPEGNVSLLWLHIKIQKVSLTSSFKWR